MSAHRMSCHCAPTFAATEWPTPAGRISSSPSFVDRQFVTLEYYFLCFPLFKNITFHFGKLTYTAGPAHATAAVRSHDGPIERSEAKEAALGRTRAARTHIP